MGASATEKLQFKIVPFADWRRDIAPLWLMEGSYRYIPPIINGYGQVQYAGRELTRKIVLFPIVAEYEGEGVGWTSIFNISHEAVRVRGIYVLPEFRSNNIGRSMVEFAMSLWPAPWKHCFMYARASNIERYKRWGFSTGRGHGIRTFDELGRVLNEAGIVLMHKTLPQVNAIETIARNQAA